MKICILNPSFGDNFVRVARWAAKSRGRVQRHPEYLLTAAQILLDSGHDVIFIDASARNLKPEDTYSFLETFKPEMVVIHATTPSIYNDIEQAAEIKKRTGAKIAFIGQHVSAEVDNTFEVSNGAIDYILRGEYDFTLRDLANGDYIEHVAGLSWVNDQDSVVHNKNRGVVDVNELPFPAWQLIDPKWYPDAGKKFPFLTLMTGRGCNNMCTFCRDPQIMYGRKLRMRSAKKVLDEMEYCLKIHPHIREIMFETDTFAADPKHVKDVCQGIIERGINEKVSWSCNMRVNTDLSLLPLMRKAGCRMLMVGFEFGTNENLKAVKKGVTIEQSKAFAECAHDCGFTIHGCFMFGAPGETPESCRATIEFAKSLPLDTVQFTGIAVYPGTSMYQWAKENDYILAKDWREWLTAEREQKTLLSYPQLSSTQIDEFIDAALKEFYLRPKQILAMFLAIRSFGDLLRKFYGLFAFIDYFKAKLFKGKKNG